MVGMRLASPDNLKSALSRLRHRIGGHVDRVEEGDTLIGWAADLADPSRRVIVECVHEGRVIAAATANEFREDIKERRRRRRQRHLCLQADGAVRRAARSGRSGGAGSRAAHDPLSESARNAPAQRRLPLVRRRRHRQQLQPAVSVLPGRLQRRDEDAADGGGDLQEARDAREQRPRRTVLHLVPARADAASEVESLPDADSGGRAQEGVLHHEPGAAAEGGGLRGVGEFRAASHQHLARHAGRGAFRGAAEVRAVRGVQGEPRVDDIDLREDAGRAEAALHHDGVQIELRRDRRDRES